MRLPGIIGVVYLAALASGVVWGQISSGSIAGTVTDSSGAPIVAAIVAVTDPATNSLREVSSDIAGGFRISNLTPGSYEVAVTKTGFRSLRQMDVHVDSNRTDEFSLIMEVASVSESLNVPARPPAVDIEKGSGVDEILEFAELADLVQDSRTVTDLAYLLPGVGRRAKGGLGSGFVMGGARSDNVNFVVDGFSDYDPRTGGVQSMPNYDAIEEFRVQTSGSAAEYGRMAGGVINMSLREGTNTLHGSAFELYRTDALNARNFFDSQKSEFLRNQVGATIAGPVVIPRLYRRANRTFFLASWENLHLASGENRFSQVPTLAERGGDFSSSLDASGHPVVVKDPITGIPFAKNHIPAARMDSVAQQIASFYPLPNRSDPTDNYHASELNRTDWNSLVFKLDERPSENDAIGFRYLTRVNSSGSPYTGSDLGLFGSRANSLSTLAGVTYTRVLGPSLVNEARAGFVRMSDHEASVYAGHDINAQLGLPSITNDPHLVGFPRFTVLNLAAIGDSTGMPVDYTVNNYEIADAVSWTRGHHLLKIGADLLRTQFFQQLYNNSRGSFNFLGRASGVPFADLLLGLPDSTSRQSSSEPAYLFSSDWGLFVQDHFAVTPRLALDFGLRYEMMRPPYEKQGRMSSFVPELDKVVIADPRSIPDLPARLAAAGLTGRVITASQAGLPNSLVYANKLDLAPRIGLAVRPFRNSTLVVRAGYGIFYADSLLNPIRNDLTNVYPFTVSQTFNRVSGKPLALTLANPFPASLASLPGVTNVNGFELHPGAQYLQSYNASIEQELASDTTLEIEYVGSRGLHLQRQYDLNQPFRDPSLELPNGSFPRPYTGFGTINFYGFGSNSFYNAGSASLRRRWHNGFFYGLTYTFSKSIDDASQISGNSSGGYPGAQDSRDLRADRGRSDWDTGHSLQAFGSYQVPRGRHPFLRGWQVSAAARLYSGQPFTPRVANANLNLGEANRPDRVAQGGLPGPSVADWFNLAAFPVVPSGSYRFGNSGRNILDGPGSVTIDAAIMKNFRLGEQRSLQFRCEALNVMNHANFGSPVNFVDAQNAGQILSADPGRNLQLALRFRF